MNIVSNPNPVQCRGNVVNENGVPYYKSNKGTVAGAVLAVPAVALNALPAFNKPDLFLPDNVIGEIKDYPEYYRYLKQEKANMVTNKKLAIPMAIIAGACTLGAGMLFDKIRNDRAKKAANDIAAGNLQNVTMHGGDVGISASGTPYYKSNNGVKYGALTGAACGAIAYSVRGIAQKTFGFGGFLLSSAFFSLGGLIMGAIAQSASNKAAEKSTYMA